MRRNTWLGLSLAAALGIAGVAIAQERPQQPDPNKPSQMGGQQNIGATQKLDESQVKTALQQKEYLRGLSITPKVEGDKVILTGNVPSKAHLIAALLSVYELPAVKHVDCQLTFQEQAEGGGATAGATTHGKEIEVVAAIFPLHKGGEGTVQAGMPKEGGSDVIIFRPYHGGHEGMHEGGTKEKTPGSMPPK
jgi:hypothetical protein